MSQLPACEVCGSSSYNKVSGFYVCAKCDTQSQEIQEQLFEYNENVRNVEEEARREVITEVEEDRALTSWETLNLILKGYVQELIDLGASPSLRLVAFQLWATYLQKAQLVFFSKEPDKIPPLPLGFKSWDAKILYGVSNLRKIIFKDVILPTNRKRKAKSDDEAVEVDLESSTSGKSTLTIKSLRQKQRKLALLELSNSSMLNQSVVSHTESLQTLGSEDKNKRKRVKVSFKSKTHKMLKDFIHASKLTEELEEDDPVLKKLRYSFSSKCATNTRVRDRDLQATIANVITVLYVALRIIGDDIQLGDMIRWMSEGHISRNSGYKYIPADKKFDEKVFVTIGEKCTRVGMLFDIMHITKAIRLKNIPTPDLYKLATRYGMDLSLPDEFISYVHGLMNFFQSKMNYAEYDFRIFPDYECRVLAYILMAFKLLFSLDGITERKQSGFADYVNGLPKPEPGQPGHPKLFSWNAWVQYIECRKAVLSKYDPLMNFHAYQGRIDQKSVFSKLWDRMKPVKTLKTYVINPTFISSTTRLLRKVTGEPSHSNVVFPPSLTPQITNTNYLLNNHPHLVKPNVRSILENTFEKHSMLHLLDKTWCENLSKSCNCTVEFIKGVAEINTEKWKPPENSLIPDFSSSTKVPAYAPTKVEIVNEAKPTKSTTHPINHACKDFKFKCEEFNGIEITNDSTKNFKIYCPATEYWVFHDFPRNTSKEKMLELMENEFPESFSWLLFELANLIRCDVKDLYMELISLEATLYSLFQDYNYHATLPFLLQACEW